MMERGYRRGDVVAIISPNVIEYVLTFFGCAYVGITLTLLNPLEPPTVHRSQLFETNAKALFVFPLFVQQALRITESLPQIRDVFLYGYDRDGGAERNTERQTDTESADARSGGPGS